MYKVCIYNNGIETIINYPVANNDAPHLDKLPLKEGLSQVDSLSFSIYMNNIGYNLISELTTKIKVIDTRDNSIRFTGRVLDIDEKMDSNGLFYKDITCEGALSYLNDSKQRANTFITANAADFLTQILSIHNEKVDSSKQIQVGNVDVTGNVAYTCNFETTLACILAVKEKLSGDIRVRETNGILYLDWLQSFNVNTVDITLGINMKDMVKGKDITSLGTRIIPLGANNLTISSVNGGLDYIEDATAKAIYGVVEKTVEYKDITDATELYNTCLSELSKHTQPLYLLESNALDLSYLTGSKAEQFVLGTDLHITNQVMNVDSVYKVVQIDLDLLKAYDPKVTIANFPVKLSTTLNDLRKTSVQNNGVYNGVQIGDSFGVRIASSDGEIITTLNATEGISIENLIENLKLFFVDIENRTLTMDGIQQLTKNGKVVIENTVNEYGGINNIYDVNGNLVFKIGVESGASSNVGATLIGYNKDSDKPRFRLGIAKDGDFGTLQLLNASGDVKAVINADDNSGNGVFFIVDSSGASRKLATQSYVSNAISDAINTHVSAYHST